MPANDTIDFWFTVGSTYTYLTVSRLHEVEAANGIRFRWRPFNARAIMQEMNNVPFATKPIKLAYMWRDIERRASRYDLPLKVPAPYPLKNFDLASRVAVLGETEGWCPNYVRASYRRWFVEGKEVGAPRAVSKKKGRRVSALACGGSPRRRPDERHCAGLSKKSGAPYHQSAACRDGG